MKKYLDDITSATEMGFLKSQKSMREDYSYESVIWSQNVTLNTPALLDRVTHHLQPPVYYGT